MLLQFSGVSQKFYVTGFGLKKINFLTKKGSSVKVSSNLGADDFILIKPTEKIQIT